MKATKIGFLVLVGFGIAGCLKKASPNDVVGGTSGLSSVTINQPKLKEAMKSTVSDADKTKIYSALVYQISIKAQKASGKDDCDAGATATNFESDILDLDKNAPDTVKVKKGCNYIVSMKYGMKSDDGKSIKTVMLQSWDEKDPALLSKDELLKDKPTAAVNLYVTKDGLPYWDISVIQTPSDQDIHVDPQLATKFNLTQGAMTVTLADPTNGKIASSLDLTPVKAPTKDTYCGIVIRGILSADAAQNAADVAYADLYVGGDVTKSVVKFPANSAAKMSLALSKDLVLPNIYKSVKSPLAYAVCASDEASALATLKNCFYTGDSGELTPVCTTNNVIQGAQAIR